MTDERTEHHDTEDDSAHGETSASVARPESSASEMLSCPTCGETITPEYRHEGVDLLDLFRRSRLARLVAAGLLGFVAAMLLIMFLYQLTMRLPSGELFRRTHLAWWYLGGHFMKAVLLGNAASIVWALDRTFSRVEPGQRLDATAFVEIHNRFWNSFALTLVLLGAYGVGTVLLIMFWSLPQY